MSDPFFAMRSPGHRERPFEPEEVFAYAPPGVRQKLEPLVRRYLELIREIDVRYEQDDLQAVDVLEHEAAVLEDFLEHELEEIWSGEEDAGSRSTHVDVSPGLEEELARTWADFTFASGIAYDRFDLPLPHEERWQRGIRTREQVLADILRGIYVDRIALAGGEMAATGDRPDIWRRVNAIPDEDLIAGARDAFERQQHLRALPRRPKLPGAISSAKDARRRARRLKRPPPSKNPLRMGSYSGGSDDAGGDWITDEDLDRRLYAVRACPVCASALPENRPGARMCPPGTPCFDNRTFWQRDKDASKARAYRAAVLGRVCSSCGKNDTLVAWSRKADLCGACFRRFTRFGACPKGHALFATAPRCACEGVRTPVPVDRLGRVGSRGKVLPGRCPRGHTLRRKPPRCPCEMNANPDDARRKLERAARSEWTLGAAYHYATDLERTDAAAERFDLELEALRAGYMERTHLIPPSWYDVRDAAVSVLFDGHEYGIVTPFNTDVSVLVLTRGSEFVVNYVQKEAVYEFHTWVRLGYTGTTSFLEYYRNLVSPTTVRVPLHVARRWLLLNTPPDSPLARAGAVPRGFMP